MGIRPEFDELDGRVVSAGQRTAMHYKSGSQVVRQDIADRKRPIDGIGVSKCPASWKDVMGLVSDLMSRDVEEELIDFFSSVYETASAYVASIR